MTEKTARQKALRLHREAQCNVVRAEALLAMCRAREATARLTLEERGWSSIVFELADEAPNVIPLSIPPAKPVSESG